MSQIALASDHAGYSLKETLKASLQAQGHTCLDYGAYSLTSVDYPDYAAQVAHSLAQGKAQWGILCCRTGMGMCMSANKFPAIRAALVRNSEDARLCRAHNNANVLCLGSFHEPAEKALLFAEVFLSTPFEGGRHATRVEKISTLFTEKNGSNSCNGSCS